MAMAKGIVTAFPELADDDGGHNSYYDLKTGHGFLSTALSEHVRKCLTPSKKRYKPRAYKQSKNTKLPVLKASKSVHNNCDLTSPLSESEVKGKVDWLRSVQPLLSLKKDIGNALDDTFAARRSWILAPNDPTPTFTDIVNEYKPLIEFNGEMIDEEFRRMFPQHLNFVEEFDAALDAILNYAALSNKTAFSKANALNPDALKAVALLCAIFPSPIVNKHTNDELKELLLGNSEHLRKFPTSALIQIVPEGTDVDSYKSVEVGSSLRTSRPIPPFIIMVSNNTGQVGDFFLKIDHKVIFLDNRSTLHAKFLRTVEVLFKAYHVFNLEYHYFIRPFFQFMEIMFGIHKGKVMPTVNALFNAIRVHKKLHSS